MAGHSKWANIKHRKAAQDAKKGKVFTKIGTELTIAVKLGGGDPTSNPRLRLALEKARAANMPRDNIERAMKKGAGDMGDQIYEDITYEVYGPGGVGILVKVLTDNRNRSFTDVRTAVGKRGCTIADAGSVSWQFDMKGVLEFPLSDLSEDLATECGLEFGAEDVIVDDDIVSVITEPGLFESIKDMFESKGYKPNYAEVTMKPQNTITVEREDALKIISLVDALEDLDDVQEVWGNYSIKDEYLEEA